MGIPGFNHWFSRDNAKAYVPLGQIKVDHLYIDMNSVLHGVIRNAKNWEHFHRLLHKRLNELLAVTRPRRSVMLAVDGPAPLAKLMTQRERRKSKRKSKRSEDPQLSGNSITPGTTFMLDITTSLMFWICAQLERNPFDMRFELSDATVKGEGELKILGRLAHHWCDCGPNDTHLIVGDDADLILLALVSYKENLYVLNASMEVNGTKPIGSTSKSPVFSVNLFHQKWQQVLLQGQHSIDLTLAGEVSWLLHGFKLDMVLAIVLNSGNDYLPPVRNVARAAMGIWGNYLQLRKEDAYRSRSIVRVGRDGVPLLDVAFLAHLVRVSAVEAGFGKWSSGGAVRYRKDKKAAPSRPPPPVVPRPVSSPVSSRLRSMAAVAISAQRPATATAAGPAVAASSIAVNVDADADYALQDGGAEEEEDDDGLGIKEDDEDFDEEEDDDDGEDAFDAEGLLVRSSLDETADGSGALSLAGGAPGCALRYVRGLAWMLHMYVRGECPDYQYLYDGVGPSAQELTDLCDSMGPVEVSFTDLFRGPSAPPFLPAACALALLPGSCMHLLPPAVHSLFSTSSPLTDLYTECRVCEQLKDAHAQTERLLRDARERLELLQAQAVARPAAAAHCLAASAPRAVAGTEALSHHDAACAADPRVLQQQAAVAALRATLTKVKQQRVQHKEVHASKPFPSELINRCLQAIPRASFQPAEQALLSFGRASVLRRMPASREGAPQQPPLRPFMPPPPPFPTTYNTFSQRRVFTCEAVIEQEGREPLSLTSVVPPASRVYLSWKIKEALGGPHHRPVPPRQQQQHPVSTGIKRPAEEAAVQTARGAAVQIARAGNSGKTVVVAAAAAAAAQNGGGRGYGGAGVAVAGVAAVATGAGTTPVVTQAGSKSVAGAGGGLGAGYMNGGVAGKVQPPAVQGVAGRPGGAASTSGLAGGARLGGWQVAPELGGSRDNGGGYNGASDPGSSSGALLKGGGIAPGSRDGGAGRGGGETAGRTGAGGGQSGPGRPASAGRGGSGGGGRAGRGGTSATNKQASPLHAAASANAPPPSGSGQQLSPGAAGARGASSDHRTTAAEAAYFPLRGAPFVGQPAGGTPVPVHHTVGPPVVQQQQQQPLWKTHRPAPLNGGPSQSAAFVPPVLPLMMPSSRLLGAALGASGSAMRPPG